MRVRLIAATAAALLSAALVATQASSRSAGKATVKASGAFTAKLSGSCVIPVNPENARLHKRFVILNFSRTGKSITATIDVWKTGRINLAKTKTDSIGLGTGTAAGVVSGWFAGWTGTQAPALSPKGAHQGSGTIVVSRGAHSGTLNATLVASPNNKNRNKRPLHLKGSWSGC